MFQAIAGAMLPSLAGGLVDKFMGGGNTGKGWARKNRKWDRRDFVSDRDFSIAQAERQLASDRAYYAKALEGDRAYGRKLTAEDRRYAEGRTAADRAYLAKLAAQDRAAFDADQSARVRESAKFERMQAASRGVNFAKLRDDAIKAGFNPLTALSLASMYSTEVDYENPREVYAAGSAYAGGSSPVVASNPGTGAVGPMSSPAPIGGFQSSGAGYVSPSTPTLSSGSFLAQALDNGIQTYFNNRNDTSGDWLEANTARKSAAVEAAREILRQTPRDFGYSLTKVQPYRPAMEYAAPVFSFGDARARAMPSETRQALSTGQSVSGPVFRTPFGEVPISGRYSKADDMAEYGGELGDMLGAFGMASDWYDSTSVGRFLNRFERPARYAPARRKTVKAASARPYAKPSKNYANR